MDPATGKLKQENSQQQQKLVGKINSNLVDIYYDNGSNIVEMMVGSKLEVLGRSGKFSKICKENIFTKYRIMNILAVTT
ncbi:hypothetical protein GYW21_10135 [Lactobacillus mellis]|nr:hypothetical protein [Bombilactobacillus mellis]